MSLYLIDRVNLERIIIISWSGDRRNSCLQLCKHKTMSLSSQMSGRDNSRMMSNLDPRDDNPKYVASNLNQSGMSFYVIRLFSSFIVEIHSNSFHAVRPLTRWMSIDPRIKTDRCHWQTWCSSSILLTSLQVPHPNFRAPDGLFMAMLYWNSPPFPSAQFLQ